ncbi:hypothetical protein U1701_18625, partial [Sphingomonas sp. PB2P19]|uniref:hypothetical protein n=1 Tax=Sphingomonas rhamnosi TaxID=3096156 RepID=UPI002FC92B5D
RSSRSGGSSVSQKADMSLHAFVARGPNSGTLLFPHQHRDGSYVVSMTRFEKDYIYVDARTDLLGWLEKGYRLRMSNKDAGAAAPSLIEPSKIYRPVLI